MSQFFLTQRLFNLFRSALSIFIGDRERNNPELVYEQAISSLTQKHQQLRKAAASLIVRRDQLTAQEHTLRQELETTERQLEQALAIQDSELGGIIIQKQDLLKQQIQAVSSDLEVAVRDAEQIKQSLTEHQAEVSRIKTERDRNIARLRSAQARIQVSDQLEGLSVDADLKALENVRSHIEQTVGQANLNDELKSTDLDQRLKALDVRGAKTASEQKFKALLAQRSQEAQPLEGSDPNDRKRI